MKKEENNSDDPLITVVIPTYNRFRYLREAIDSVIAQSYDRWQLFVVDDGSTDETISMPQQYSDERIHFAFLEHGGNIARLRNYGAMNGRGEWVIFLDSDDCWPKDRLELQLRQLQNTRRRWSYGRYILMDEQGHEWVEEKNKFRPLDGWIAKQILKDQTAVAVGTWMVSKKTFEELGGFNEDPKLVCREDIDFILRLAIKEEGVSTNRLMARIREHPTRTTHTVDGFERSAYMWKLFLSSAGEKDLRKIASRKYGWHLTESAAMLLKNKKYATASGKLMHALFARDKLRHILSAIKRGLFQRP
jgi:glycosyltransferase involved in cell wall biosynthesis